MSACREHLRKFSRFDAVLDTATLMSMVVPAGSGRPEKAAQDTWFEEHGVQEQSVFVRQASPQTTSTIDHVLVSNPMRQSGIENAVLGVKHLKDFKRANPDTWHFALVNYDSFNANECISEWKLVDRPFFSKASKHGIALVKINHPCRIAVL